MDKIKFISGGQTGIDRAMLDFCLEQGIDCGGWCPENRIAEDGQIDLKYPVIELPGGGTQERTIANVKQGDATVIIYYKEKTGGTLYSYESVLKHQKPFLLLDMSQLSAEEAAAKFRSFLTLFNPSVINFSGPRATEWKEGYQQCMEILTKVIAVL